MVYACVYLVHLLLMACILLGFDSGFNLALPFLDSHGVMGFILG